MILFLCLRPPPPKKVGVALVLGGGGARGMAHVGVLEELEKAGITIDLIVGCSAGSIVGAFYADCLDVAKVKACLTPLKKWDILDLSLYRCRYGLAQGRAFRRFLASHIGARYFNELKIPVCIVATDLIKGQLICLNDGPLIPAIHASSAIPLLFSPVLLHERLLVDGGVADPVPVSIAQKMGAKIIIAVDLNELLPKTSPSNLFGVAARSAEIKFLLQSASCLEGADVIIRPELEGVSIFADDNHEQVYLAGREAAIKALPKIIQLISSLTTCP